MKKYTFEDEVTVENLMKFYDDFTNGKLKSFLKSDPVPKENDKPVKIVVGKNFNEIVMDDTKDVILMIQAEWCGHCKNFKPHFQKAAETLSKINENIVFGMMDGTSNEAEGLEIKGFPTVNFYPAKNKKKPVKFEKDRDYEGLLKFLKA